MIPRSPQNGHSNGSCFLFPHELPIPPRLERFEAAAALRTTFRPMDRAEDVGAPLCPGMMFADDAAGDGARLRLWKEDVSEHVE